MQSYGSLHKKSCDWHALANVKDLIKLRSNPLYIVCVQSIINNLLLVENVCAGKLCINVYLIKRYQ